MRRLFIADGRPGFLRIRDAVEAPDAEFAALGTIIELQREPVVPHSADVGAADVAYQDHAAVIQLSRSGVR